MKTKFQHLFLGCSLMILAVSSCKKEQTEAINDIEVEDASLMEETSSDEFLDINSLNSENSMFLTGGSGTLSDLKSPYGDCATLTVSPTGDKFPKTVTVDFGTGCTKGNNTRKGKIIMVYTDRFKNPNATLTITYDNFYINDKKIEGTRVLKNNGKNAAGNYSFTSTISNAKIIFNDNKSRTWSANRTYEWYRGESTSTASDDEFYITGSASGTNARDKTYTNLITKALVKKVGCPFLVAGSVDHQIDGRPKMSLDFGDGTCDNDAVLSTENKSRSIKLKK